MKEEGLLPRRRRMIEAERKEIEVIERLRVGVKIGAIKSCVKKKIEVIVEIGTVERK